MTLSKTQKTWNMTEGSPAKLLISFCIPLLIGNIFSLLYSVVDSAVVGKFVGENEFGGIGATGSIDFLFFSIGYGISAGVGILIASMFGAGQEDRLTKAIYNSYYALTGVSLLIAASGYFLGPVVLRWMNTPEENYEFAAVYMQTISIGCIANFLYGGAAAIMRSFGDSRTPLYIQIFACGVNIGLDFLFVLVFHMSVQGVAIATIIAQFLAAIISVVVSYKRIPYYKITPGCFKPDKQILASFVRLGLPIAGQNLLIAGSCMALQYVVNGFGSVVVNTYTAVNKLDQIVQQPFSSLATGISTYTSQNAGARQMDRIRKGLKTGLIISTAVALFTTLIMELFAGGFLSIFVNDAEIISLGSKALRITSSFYIFLGILYVVRGLLNGAGDSKYSAINGFVEMACRFGLAYPLTLIPFLGMWGCFLCNGLTWCITGIISYLRYKQGIWKDQYILK